MFDKYCLFTNRVNMSADQASLLRHQVEAAQKPAIPYYVCTMRKSHVKHPKYMMVNTSLYLFLSTTSKSASYNLRFFSKAFQRSLLPTTLQDSSMIQLICPFIYHSMTVVVIMMYRSRLESLGWPLLLLDGGDFGGLQD